MFENDETTSNKQSCMSTNDILLSFLLYLFNFLNKESNCETKEVFTAFSGAPPCSSQLEL